MYIVTTIIDIVIFCPPPLLKVYIYFYLGITTGITTEFSVTTNWNLLLFTLETGI